MINKLNTSTKFLNREVFDEPQYKGRKYLSKSELLKDYGFTNGIIKNYLHEPLLFPNPYYKNAGKMQCWRTDYIKSAIESNNELREALNRTICRRFANMIKW